MESRERRESKIEREELTLARRIAKDAKQLETLHCKEMKAEKSEHKKPKSKK